MPAFRKQAPEQLTARLFVLEYIRENHIPDDLERLTPGTKMVEELFDENSQPALFFNWEFMLFECPLPELDYMGTRLYNERLKLEEKVDATEGVREAQMRDEIQKRKVQGDAWKGGDALGAMLDKFEADQKKEKTGLLTQLAEVPKPKIVDLKGNIIE